MRTGFFLLMLFTSQIAWANLSNTFWDGTGENDFYIQLDSSSFPSSKAGTKLQLFYKTPAKSSYSLNYNNQTSLTNPPSWLAGETSLMPSDINSGYLKLNENLDIKVSMPHGEMVPFSWSYQGGSASLNYGMGRAFNRFFYGMEGELSLILRRDMVGGGVLLPRNVQAASIYRSMSPSSGSPPEAKNPLPALRIFLKGQVVPTPVVCSINNEKVIDVVFGELNSADITLDGSHYGKDITISYSCNRDVNMPVTINLIANNTRFSGDYILTSNPELGVVMKYHSRTIKPWGSFTTHLVSGKGDDWIYFAPVRKAPTRAMPTGKFTASATLVIMIE